MSSITNFFKGISSYFSNDIVILFVLFIIFFFYTLYFGKNRAISTILAFYPAQFFYEHFPFLKSLIILKGDTMVLINHVVIFLLFLIPISILIGRYVFSDSGFGSSHYLRTAGYSLAMAVMVLIFSYSIIDLDSIHNFSPTVDVLFNSPDKIFWWQLAPLALLFIL